MKYVIAWAMFGCVLYGGFVAVHSFKNPWAPHATVLEMLPPSSDGCSKDCGL